MDDLSQSVFVLHKDMKVGTMDGDQYWKMRITSIHRGKGCIWVVGTWFYTPAELEKLQLSPACDISEHSKILTSLANPTNFPEIKPSSTSWEKQRWWHQTIGVPLMQGALKVGDPLILMNKL
jgi:hypothetical protein